jgi:hypothetical protein
VSEDSITLTVRAATSATIPGKVKTKVTMTSTAWRVLILVVQKVKELTLRVEV